MAGNKTVHEKDCKIKTKLGYICASMNYDYLRKEYALDYTLFRILDEITSVQKAIKQFLKFQGFDENIQQELIYLYYMNIGLEKIVQFLLN